MVIKAFILAGGKGARLRPLTLHTPKPIVPVANIPFLFFQIDHIKQAGITEIILSLSYQPRKIEDMFGDGIKYGVTMRYTHEDLPLGTNTLVNGKPVQRTRLRTGDRIQIGSTALVFQEKPQAA